MNDPLQVWDKIAQQYLQIVDTAPHNALYERPAMLELIGRPSGCRVLDLGCGSGFYLEYLNSVGAAYLAGIDGNELMLKATAQRTSGRATLYKADLRQPRFPFLEKSTFDLVVASLVLHYIEDWRPLLFEMNRTLRPGGEIVVSSGHPMADFNESPTGDYFKVEHFQEEWSSFGVSMPTYRRPLSAMTEAFRAAGFVLTRLVEPVPLPEMANSRPKSFEKLSRTPGFLCLKFAKNSDVLPGAL